MSTFSGEPQVLGPRRFTTDVERVLFALTANRALDPGSKLAATEWVAADVAISALETMSDDQASRAMDLLAEADTTASAQEAVFFSVANLLNLKVDVLLFDTTSTYFERDTPDPGPLGEPGGRVPPLRPLQGPSPGPAAGGHRAGGDQGGHPGAGVVLAGEHLRHLG